jgi:hypothetical protein
MRGVCRTSATVQEDDMQTADKVSAEAKRLTVAHVRAGPNACGTANSMIRRRKILTVTAQSSPNNPVTVLY